MADDRSGKRGSEAGVSPLGRFVRARREELGLSQDAVGRALDTSHAIISNLETKAGYNLNKRHLPALAAVLDTPLDVLLELEGLKAPQPGKPRTDQQEAINLVLQMDAEKIRLAKALLRTLLEDGQPPPRVRRRAVSAEPVP